MFTQKNILLLRKVIIQFIFFLLYKIMLPLIKNIFLTNFEVYLLQILEKLINIY